MDRAPRTFRPPASHRDPRPSRARPGGSASRSCPASGAAVDLSDLPADYDVALYGDIEAAFDQLTHQLGRHPARGRGGRRRTGLARPRCRCTRPRSTHVPTSAADLPSTQFAPRIYAPRIYAPRIYAPRIYAPADLRAADLRAADLRTRLLHTRTSTPTPPSATRSRPPRTRPCSPCRPTPAPTAETRLGLDGQHRRATSTSACRATTTPSSTRTDAVPARPRRSRAAPRCAGLEDFADAADAARRPARDARTVIVTDTNKLALEPTAPRSTTPTWPRWDGLAAATDGVVVDVARLGAGARPAGTRSPAHPDCPYAVNLVAGAIKEIVDSYRNDRAASTS